MKRAFTLVELMIVVAILGILAAVVLPTVSSHVAKAKEASAKDNLRIVRNGIDLYASQHKDCPPGYLNGTLPGDDSIVEMAFFKEFVWHYLSEMPKNPYNGRLSLKILRNNSEFVADGINEYGWLYKPETKEIRLNWPGTDSEGVQYVDY